MFNRGHNLETRRNEIIMACLSGGQHIDAALEAADRLAPQSEIDKAYEEDNERYVQYFTRSMTPEYAAEVKPSPRWLKYVWPF